MNRTLILLLLFGLLNACGQPSDSTSVQAYLAAYTSFVELAERNYSHYSDESRKDRDAIFRLFDEEIYQQFFYEMNLSEHFTAFKLRLRYLRVKTEYDLMEKVKHLFDRREELHIPNAEASIF